MMVMVMVVINWLEPERLFHGFRTSGSRQRSTSSTTATTARAAHPPPPQTLLITRSELVMLVNDPNMHRSQSLLCDHGLVD